VYLEFEIWRIQCKACGMVRMEHLAWLAKHPATTKRFAQYVGQRCRTESIRDVAKELGLDWKTVKDMEKEYMTAQIEQATPVEPRIIGIDEISVRKGHEYRIVVSDLELRRAIWFGGKDRTEESMKEFYDWLGPTKTANIRLVVMDMWKAFENATQTAAPQAAILYDKFHVVRHLNEALDKIRRSEYARLTGTERKFVKGHRYTLLSRKANLKLPAKRALKMLLSKNKRLYVAYVLKESFEQLWEYTYEGAARTFFDNWKKSLKKQRLKPYEKFAKTIDRHWEGIAAYCKPENRISLGFVEGLNNKIRVFQRRAYGLKDQEYLRLKVLSCMLPELSNSPT
jgi:transposase